MLLIHMRVSCNEIKRVLNANLSSDPWTENKPITQLLGAVRMDGLTLRGGGAWNVMAWGQGRKVPQLPSQREGQMLGSSQRSIMDLPLFFPHLLLREKVLFLPAPLGRAEIEKTFLFLTSYI